MSGNWWTLDLTSQAMSLRNALLAKARKKHPTRDLALENIDFGVSAHSIDANGNRRFSDTNHYYLTVYSVKAPTWWVEDMEFDVKVDITGKRAHMHVRVQTNIVCVHM